MSKKISLGEAMIQHVEDRIGDAVHALREAAYQQGFENGEADWRYQERARIVSWLRDYGVGALYIEIANAIEARKHLCGDKK